MDEDSLCGIIVQSRFNFGGSAVELARQIAANRAVNDMWLQEAAEAARGSSKVQEFPRERTPCDSPGKSSLSVFKDIF